MRGSLAWMENPFWKGRAMQDRKEFHIVSVTTTVASHQDAQTAMAGAAAAEART